MAACVRVPTVSHATLVKFIEENFFFFLLLFFSFFFDSISSHGGLEFVRVCFDKGKGMFDLPFFCRFANAFFFFFCLNNY